MAEKMDTFLYSLALIIMVIAFVTAIGSFLLMVRSLMQMVTRIRTDAPLIKGLWLNPFNVIWRPKFLTEEGLLSRRSLLQWTAAFAASLLVAFACSYYVNALVT